jgi:nucleoside-diphosphate-sugar epimerase
MVEGARPVIFGDGRQTRDFVYVENVVDANIAAATTPAASGRVFNIGSGSSTDLLKLVDELRSVLGSDIEPVHEPPRSGDILHSYADVTRAAGQLGWTPAVGFAEGLASTVRWFAGSPRTEA